MRRRLTVLAFALSGCSVVVGDLSPGACMRFEDCDALNVRDRLDARSCELWTCRFPHGQIAGTCERGPRDRDGDGAFGPPPSSGACSYTPTDCDDLDRLRDATEELCDGADNDCDLAIDETFEPGTFAATPITLGTLGTRGALHFPPSQELSLVLLATSTATDLDASAVVLGASVEAMPLTYETYCGSSTPIRGCALSTCDSVIAGCSVGQPALDRAGEGAWIAAVNLTGCARGELRVGRYDGAGHVEIDSAGDAAFGAPPCTVEGARAPAIATLDPSSASGAALVAHYAEPWDAARACGAEAGVRGVRLRGAVSAAGRTGRFELEGTLDLGRATSVAPPALAALPDRSGWLVAFGRAAGGVELALVRASGELVPLAPIEGTAPASLVVARAGAAGVGLAWIEGCGSSGPARFAQLSMAGSIEGQTSLDASASDVTLVALSQGLVEPGFTRGGRTAGETSRGGWLVATSDGNAIRVQRLLELDSQPLGETQSIELATRRIGLTTRAGERALPAELHAWRSDAELARVSLGCGR